MSNTLPIAVPNIKDAIKCRNNTVQLIISTIWSLRVSCEAPILDILEKKNWPCYNDTVLYLQNALIVFSFVKSTCGCSLSNTQNCKNVIDLIVLKILSRCCSIKRFDATISMCKNTKCIEITSYCLGIGHDMRSYVFSYIWGDIISNMYVCVFLVQYIPRNMHTVFALLCFVVVIHWPIFPYPSGLLHWHCGNLTIAPVPAKQPWWIWINTSCVFIMNDCITTTKQSTTKPCAYFLGYTVLYSQSSIISHKICTPSY